MAAQTLRSESIDAISEQLGIPFEGVVLAVAFDVICDRTHTAASITSLPLELIEIALSLQMIDEETLRD